MPLDPGFAADCPYGPGAQLLDEGDQTASIVAHQTITGMQECILFDG